LYIRYDYTFAEKGSLNVPSRKINKYVR